MSPLVAIKKTWRPEEYLAWERLQPEKHEFHGGAVFDRARATFEHNQIVINVGAELRALLRQKPCRVCASSGPASASSSNRSGAISRWTSSN
jgi:hypothetical protein